ncbi:hypothetical protein P4O66_012203, partial [Electrophorus voltai]
NDAYPAQIYLHLHSECQIAAPAAFYTTVRKYSRIPSSENDSSRNADHSRFISFLPDLLSLTPRRSTRSLQPSQQNALPLQISSSPYGPPGVSAAIKTKLGWMLQGPGRLLETQLQPQQCLFLSSLPSEMELKRDVERLAA